MEGTILGQDIWNGTRRASHELVGRENCSGWVEKMWLFFNGEAWRAWFPLVHARGGADADKGVRNGLGYWSLGNSLLINKSVFL